MEDTEDKDKIMGGCIVWWQQWLQINLYEPS